MGCGSNVCKAKRRLVGTVWEPRELADVSLLHLQPSILDLFTEHPKDQCTPQELMNFYCLLNKLPSHVFPQLPLWQSWTEQEGRLEEEATPTAAVPALYVISGHRCLPRGLKERIRYSTSWHGRYNGVKSPGDSSDLLPSCPGQLPSLSPAGWGPCCRDYHPRNSGGR